METGRLRHLLITKAGIFLVSAVSFSNKILHFCFMLEGCPLGSSQPQGTFVIRQPIRSDRHLVEPALDRDCAGRVPGRALEATQTQWTVSTVSAEWIVWEPASKISREISPFLSPHQVLRRMPPTRLRLLGTGDNHVMPFFSSPKAIVTRLSPASCPLPFALGP